MRVFGWCGVLVLAAITGLLGGESTIGLPGQDTRSSGALEARAVADAAVEPRKHGITNLNVDGSIDATVALGYNVLDVNMDIDAINALPAGTQAVVWVGNTICDPEFAVSAADFDAFVAQHAGSTKIWGYYLSDEPDGSRCPEIVQEIKRRADYLHQHAPQHKAYIAVTDWPYEPVNESQTHVDVFGMDPYPCRIGKPCDYDLIDREVSKAVSAGIPQNKMAPIYQAFGQTCNEPGEDRTWRLPTADEMNTLLARWDQALPDAPIDFTYTWNDPWNSCPSLALANGVDYPNLQEVLKAHNASG